MPCSVHLPARAPHPTSVSFMKPGPEDTRLGLGPRLPSRALSQQDHRGHLMARTGDRGHLPSPASTLWPLQYSLERRRPLPHES